MRAYYFPAIKFTKVEATPGDYSTSLTKLEPIVSTEPKTDETPEQQLIRWAVNHRLITKEMNLVKFLNEAGWTTIDQMEKEFSVHDIPDDFPERFKTRLMNAVRALRNEDPIVVEQKNARPVVIVVNAVVSHKYSYYRDAFIDLDGIVNPFLQY